MRPLAMSQLMRRALTEELAGFLVQSVQDFVKYRRMEEDILEALCLLLVRMKHNPQILDTVLAVLRRGDYGEVADRIGEVLEIIGADAP